MTKPNKKPAPTTEAEFLADEIEELERPSLKSVTTWAVALAVFGVASLIVSGFMLWEAAGRAKSLARREAMTPPTPIALQSLEAGLETAPHVFRWQPIPGAETYVVVIRNAGLDETVMIRLVREPYVTATDVESSNFVPGRYVWSIEARRPDGSRVGYGEGTFPIE